MTGLPTLFQLPAKSSDASCAAGGQVVATRPDTTSARSRLTGADPTSKASICRACARASRACASATAEEAECWVTAGVRARLSPSGGGSGPERVARARGASVPIDVPARADAESSPRSVAMPCMAMPTNACARHVHVSIHTGARAARARAHGGMDGGRARGGCVHGSD